MKILIFNWRDIKNPSSGGAEILTHEMAKRWVAKGHLVTLFTSFYEGAQKKEIIDGVHIVRKGHPDARFLFWSVHFLAFLHYIFFFKGKYDVVVDEIHGLPFFTPLYVKEKKVALICEVANELWLKAYGSVFGTIGRIIEVLYIKLIYKNIHFAAISKSTEKELILNGVNSSKIKVLPMGISTFKVEKKIAKEKIPTLLCIGRLSKMKGIEEALRAIYILKEKGQRIQLKVIGRGDKRYVDFLYRMCEDLHISNEVKFLGFVSEREKFNTIASSHILISPSTKEGFGLTIPEAGSMGVPSVVYPSSGLLNVVIDHKTGLICKKSTPESLSESVSLLLADQALYEKLSIGAKEESKKYNWDNTAKDMLSLLVSL